MGHLSTHVLDTSRGAGAPGIAVEVHLLREGQRVSIASAMTNVQGRTDQPLISGSIAVGVYELTFHAGEYFLQSGVVLPNPPFLDDIVIRIGLSDPDGRYHVPLLLSPYGYSTYRGT